MATLCIGLDKVGWGGLQKLDGNLKYFRSEINRGPGEGEEEGGNFE